MPRHLIGCPDDNKGGLVADKSPKAILTLTYGVGSTTVIADGSASFARQGTLRRWRIDFGDGSVISGSGFPPANTPYTYSGPPGIVDITLYVEDNKGRMDLVHASTELTNPAPPNLPPEAVLTLLTAGTVSDVVQVSTSGSRDVDGALVSGFIQWGDGSPNTPWISTVTEYFHAYASAATYTITLSLTDNASPALTTTAQILVIVAADPIPPDPDPPPDPLPTNVPPQAVFTYLFGQFAGQPYTFSTTDTVDLDGTLVSGSVNWGDGSALETWTTPLPATLSHIYAAAGTYTVTYQVTDNGGLSSPLTRIATIQAVPVPPDPPVNAPPVATISRTAGVYAGEVFVFALAASDPDGTIATWSFSPGDGTAAVGGLGDPPDTRTHIYTVVHASRSASLTVVDNEGLARTVAVTTAVLAVPVPPPPSTSDNAYFDALVARASHYVNYSLRNTAQIAAYRHGSAINVFYLYPNDPDPRQIDLAKIIIPDFPATGAVLSAPMTSGATSYVTASGTANGPNIYYKLDNEIVKWQSTVVAGDGTVTTTVLRAQLGTSAAVHVAGTSVGIGTNSLGGPPKLPLRTVDGHNYLCTWDFWFGAELKNPPSGLTTWKHFTFRHGTSGSDGTKAIEIRTRFDASGLASDEIGRIDVRRYVASPDATGDVFNQIAPFTIKSQKRTRYWALLECVVGDGRVDGVNWDRFSLWVGDETRPAVKLIDRVRYETNSGSILNLWFECGTSVTTIAPNRGPLVSYGGNFVALLDDPDVAGVIAGAGTGGGVTPPVTGELVVYDTFTAAVTVELSTWISDNGATWAISQQVGPGLPGALDTPALPSVLWKVADGSDWISPMFGVSTGSRASYTVTPPVGLTLSADYYMEFPLHGGAVAGPGRFFYIMLRCTAPGTFYGLGFYNSGTVPNNTFLFKMIGDVYTELAAGYQAWSPGYHTPGSVKDIVKGQIVGDTISLWRNGINILQTTDGTITAAGLPGLGMGNVRVPTNRTDSSLAITHLSVVNLG